MIVLETERLILRELTGDDVENLLTIFSDPVAMRFYPSTKSREATKRWIEWNRTGYHERHHGLWAMIDKASNRFVGECGIVAQTIDGVDESEIGYHVKRELWGRGYATEGAIACREHGFGVLGKTRLVSWIHPDNQMSIRVAEKTGMELDRITKDKQGRPALLYAVHRDGEL